MARRMLAITLLPTATYPQQDSDMLMIAYRIDRRLTDGHENVSHYSPTYRHLSPARFLMLISLRGWVNCSAIMQLGILGQLEEWSLL
jgi:hypothetical protein